MHVKHIAEFYGLTLEQFFELPRNIQVSLIRKYYETHELARYTLV